MRTSGTTPGKANGEEKPIIPVPANCSILEDGSFRTTKEKRYNSRTKFGQESQTPPFFNLAGNMNGHITVTLIMLSSSLAVCCLHEY